MDAAYLKARALIALAELPMRSMPDEQHIHVNADQGVFYLSLHGEGNRFVAEGALPLADLPEIQDALQENRVLQSAYLVAQVRQPKHMAAMRALEITMQATIRTAIDMAPLMTDNIKAAIINGVAETFKPQFAAIAMARQSDLTKAMPHYSEMMQDKDGYLKSIDDRALVVVRQADAKIMAPAIADVEEELETMQP